MEWQGLTKTHGRLGAVALGSALALLACQQGGEDWSEVQFAKVTHALTVAGTSSGETLEGSSGADTVAGDEGNDTLYGYAGDDTVAGDDGNDTLYGDGEGVDFDIARMSEDSGGDGGGGPSGETSLTEDGALVAFYSAADDLVTGDTNSTNDIFVKTAATGAI